MLSTPNKRKAPLLKISSDGFVSAIYSSFVHKNLPKWNKMLNTYVRSGMASPKLWVSQNVWFYASNSILF